MLEGVQVRGEGGALLGHMRAQSLHGAGDGAHVIHQVAELRALQLGVIGGGETGMWRGGGGGDASGLEEGRREGCGTLLGRAVTGGVGGLAATRGRAEGGGGTCGDEVRRGETLAERYAIARPGSTGG